ncbi:ribosomal protein L4 [Pluteus cervinus]|uniref:Ribosomal protein L4 n=1 Tax=Pluteus cervinus TaxID=181527 RepID=A0ACD3BGB4_9AGAR|nr:ribosomal protein L4 [Pluteus cervinus]
MLASLSQRIRVLSSRTVHLRALSSTQVHHAQAASKLVDTPEHPALTPVLLSLSPPFVQKASDPTPEDFCVALDPTVFNHPVRRDILHLCVVHYLDSLRQGSANTKTRGEVRGSGIKIRRQKGSGRARLGDGQSPMLVGGGVAFGPKPRDFSTKLPRKVIEMGLRVALSAKLKEQRLGIMQNLSWPNVKTKHLAQRIDALGCRKTLFVTGEGELPKDLERVMRNIPAVDVVTPKDLNVYQILKWPRLVMDLKAVEYFEQTLSKAPKSLQTALPLP